DLCSGFHDLGPSQQAIALLLGFVAVELGFDGICGEAERARCRHSAEDSIGIQVPEAARGPERREGG
ncbi:MAG: hypothetical protein VYA48_09070, partial [Gemmatimonadota bacterium]|nr:hypothetical protein [Gemmatimonadota bacterium]